MSLSTGLAAPQAVVAAATVVASAEPKLHGTQAQGEAFRRAGPLTSTRWVVSNGQFHAQGEIGQNRHRTERTLSDFRRPADQITLPEIAIFGGGRLFGSTAMNVDDGWCGMAVRV